MTVSGAHSCLPLNILQYIHIKNHTCNADTCVPGAGSFWGPEGQWDFSRDANQRWMLLAARDRGACIFEAFSNSPPYWMTVSGRSSGNVFPWLDNLQPRYQEQFVHYLAEVVRWFHDTHGLTFRCAHVRVGLAIIEIDRLLLAGNLLGLRPCSDLESLGQLKYRLGSP